MADFMTPVQFALSTAASGTQDIECPSGVPVAFKITMSNATADDTPVDHVDLSIGFCDGTNQFVQQSRTEDGPTSTDVGRAHRTDAVIISWDEGGSELHRFAFTKILEDGVDGETINGVRLTITTQAAAAYLGTITFIGCASAGVSFYDDLGNSSGTDDYTDPGDEFDLVFFLATGWNAPPNGNNQSTTLFSYGVAINNVAEDQACGVWGEANNGSDAAVTSIMCNDAAVCQVHGDSYYYRATIEAFDADGWTWNLDAGAGNDIVGWMGIVWSDNPDVSLTEMHWDTSTDYDETGESFTPTFAEIHCIAGPTARNTKNSIGNQYNASSSYIQVSDTLVNCINVTSDDNEATSMNEQTSHSNSVLIRDVDNSTQVAAGFDGFTSTGLEFDVTTNPNQDVLGWCLMFAPEDVGGTPFDETSTGAESYEWTGYAATLALGRAETSAGAESYEWTGYAATLARGWSETSTGAETYEWTGYAATLARGLAQTSSGAEEYEWTGYAATLTRGLDQGSTGAESYEWTGYAATGLFGGGGDFNETSTGAETYEWTGYAATLAIGRAETSAGAESYEWTGYAGTLSAGFEDVSTGAESYEWTGYAATLTRGLAQTGVTGTYEWTGYAGTFTKGYDALTPASTKEYEWTGYAATLVLEAPLAYQINDCKEVALTLAGYSGDVGDQLRAYYLDNGATDGTLDDMERQFLVARGITDAGSTQDMWILFFIAEGLTSTYMQGQREFWCTNRGVFS